MITPAWPPGTHPFASFVNPHLAQLLSRLRMDKRFVRGEGPWLWDAAGRRYLDFISNYGAVPFGYNPPEIWEALMSVRDRREPSFVQPSLLDAAGVLAERLIALAADRATGSALGGPQRGGLRTVTFTNSGAEAVEAAIKMARAATGRRRILATHNSFHGKTLGALSATGRPSYQRAFGAPVEGFDFVPYGDAPALEAAFESRPGEYAAFIVEPIQGEGGIVVPPAGYLRAARDLTVRHGALLILDEIQTGLGRTGRIFAWEEEGVVPDVMTLSKALGGGLLPIGATLASEAAYTEEFAMKHSSTFAGGALAARAGLAALERLTRNGGELLAHVRARGEQLREGLLALAQRYPHVVREVRGRGLMLGIDLHVPAGAFPSSGPGTLLAAMSELELLTPVVSSYLLDAEGLRVAPTLNGQSVIRIEPPLVVTEEQCEMALAALGRALDAVGGGRTATVLRHLVSTVPEAVPAEPAPSEVDVPWQAGEAAGGPATNGHQSLPVAPEAARSPLVGPSDDASEGRFAFLVHPLDLDNYHEFDEALADLAPEELERLADHFNPMLEPFVIGRTAVESAAGARAYGEFIVVPRTTRQILSGSRQEVVGLVRRAVALGRDRGARIVGLGAYTAIASRGGLAVTDLGVAVTTGNSFTVAAAIEALAEGARRLGIDAGRSTVAVVGAGGAIGRATALLLAPHVAHLVLVGNPASAGRALQRLAAVAGEIGHVASALRGAPEVTVTTDAPAALRQAQLVVIATNSAEEFVTPEMLAPGAVVCDMSRPPNVSRRVDRERPDVLVIDGGVIEVPGRPDFGWHFGYPPGLAYACMSETMLLALEHHYEHTSLGADLTVETIRWLQALAGRHGFRLAELRSFDRPITAERWERLVQRHPAAVRLTAEGTR